MKKNFRSAILLILLALPLIMFMSSTADALLPTFDSSLHQRPSGSYRVQVLRGEAWEDAGSLAFDRFFKEQRLDLSPLLTGHERAHIRLTQTGGGAAHIDAVLLGDAPPEQIGSADDPLALKKVSSRDLDVLDAHAKTLEFTFSANAEAKTLSLVARVEPTRVSETPFQFPARNLFRTIDEKSAFYKYRLEPPPATWEGSSFSYAPFELIGSEALAHFFGTAGPQVPENLLFKEYCQTGSGHPSGFTYGWVSHDEKNLYVKLDFTPDNTSGNKDYAIVWAKTQSGLKAFRVSDAEKTWGKSAYTYSDKAAYQHKDLSVRNSLERAWS